MASDRNQKLIDALEFFKGVPDYPATHLRFLESSEEVEQKWLNPIRCAAHADYRLKHALEVIDAMADPYSSLVRDRTTYEAFSSICWGLECRAWGIYSDNDYAKADENDSGFMQIRARLRHWNKEALKEWSASESPVGGSLATRAASKRRGYRPEIKAWMHKRGLKNRETAAKALGVGVDTLKSIMSSVGDRRYSDDTLQAVLSKIGFTMPEGER